MKTEEEARKCWCPFARSDSAPGGSYNRDYQGGGGKLCMCIASGCMAWRWGNEQTTVEVDRTQDASWKEALQRQGWSCERTYRSDDGRVEYEMRLVQAPSGFCGLAGEP